jgi:hypothetical protein
MVINRKKMGEKIVRNAGELMEGIGRKGGTKVG